MRTPFERAVAACGGMTKLAEAVGATVQVVSNWRERGIPVERCPSVERATREAGAVVLCEEMQPSIDWAALRVTKHGSKAPADKAPV